MNTSLELKTDLAEIWLNFHILETHKELFTWKSHRYEMARRRQALMSEIEREVAPAQFPGALNDVQVQIIQGHARRGQTFAALAAYNRYRHGHEV